MTNQDKPAQKRVGRPPKSPDGLPSIPTSVRIRGEIRRRLIEAAEQGERPVSEEIERRIERSFVRDELTRHIDHLLADYKTSTQELGRFQERLAAADIRIADLEAENAKLKARLREATERQLVAA
jgi:hypothetical protein